MRSKSALYQKTDPRQQLPVRFPINKTIMKNKQIWVFGGAGHLGTPITKSLDAVCKKVICIDLDRRAEDLVARDSLSHTIPISLDISFTDALVPTLEALTRKNHRGESTAADECCKYLV